MESLYVVVLQVVYTTQPVLTTAWRLNNLSNVAVVVVVVVVDSHVQRIVLARRNYGDTTSQP